jgi:hypothetical protein
MMVLISQNAQLPISVSVPFNEIKYCMHITGFNLKQSDIQNFNFVFKYLNMTLSATHRRTATIVSFNTRKIHS